MVALSTKRFTLGIIFIGVVSLLVSLHLLKYDEYDLIRIVKTKYKPPLGEYDEQQKDPGKEYFDAPNVENKVVRASDFPRNEKIIIFPKQFPGSGILEEYYSNYFMDVGDIKGKFHLFQYEFDVGTAYTNGRSESLSAAVADDTLFHKHEFKIFGATPNIKGDMKQCSNIEDRLNVEVSEPKSMQTSLDKIIGRFVEQNSDYYRELEPFFKDDVKKQLKEKTIEKYWFRLAGSSVWLEQYGVHFMISRVLYSPRGVRNQPIISLSYIQLFDENWNELEDVELIVPTNNPDLGNQQTTNDQLSMNVKYPSFLPMPMYHDASKQDNRYYGPEDPRILLVKNPKGFEEPLIIFNAYHRKSVKRAQGEDESLLTLRVKYYRSMFMGWPWQTQRGKLNTDGLPSTKYDSKLYTRAVELRRQNMPRMKTQKNWSPFISSQDRHAYSHDRYIYFVYMWSNLEILKCDLANIVNSTSPCEFTYRLNEELPDDQLVGLLRGGTQLINVRELITSEERKFPLFESLLHNIPATRDIWVGFARAHLKNCGCGQDIYRPNMVVITKDDDKYKISHITSFVSLDIPLKGWDLDKPDDVCVAGQPNVLIPNGISSWSFKQTPDGKSEIGATDYLTLSYSVSDFTVDIIHIKGLLTELLNLDQKPLLSKYKLFQKLSLSSVGYNNDNVNCALQGSNQFCKEYGEEQKKHEGEGEDQN